MNETEMADWIRHIGEKTGRADYPIKTEVIYETIEERRKRLAPKCKICQEPPIPRSHLGLCEEHTRWYKIFKNRRENQRYYVRNFKKPVVIGSLFE